MITNNVTRFLDSKKVAYIAFEHSAEITSAEESAAALNVPLEMIYKSIVVLREKPGKPILAVVPGTQKVSLKAVASAVGEKKVHLSTQVEAEQLTGLQAGGISPIALINKGFTILLDSSAQHHEQIHVSGGQRGLSLRISVKTLIEVTNAKVAPLT